MKRAMFIFLGILFLSVFLGQAKATEWGIKLQTDQAIYPVGGVLDVNITYYNLTNRPIVGICNVGGGLGCCYDIVIKDENDQVVTQPGSVFCTMILTKMTLGAYQVLNLHHRIPLIAGEYGPGVKNEETKPLPPGFYRVCFQDKHRWPFFQSEGFLPGGTSFEACVPFRIMEKKSSSLLPLK